MQTLIDLFYMSKAIADLIAGVISWVFVVSILALIFFAVFMLLWQPICIVIEKRKSD